MAARKIVPGAKLENSAGFPVTVLDLDVPYEEAGRKHTDGVRVRYDDKGGRTSLMSYEQARKHLRRRGTHAAEEARKGAHRDHARRVAEDAQELIRLISNGKSGSSWVNAGEIRRGEPGVVLKITEDAFNHLVGIVKAHEPMSALLDQLQAEQS